VHDQALLAGSRGHGGEKRRLPDPRLTADHQRATARADITDQFAEPAEFPVAADERPGRAC
jgi:hypothetical protein